MAVKYRMSKSLSAFMLGPISSDDTTSDSESESRV